MDPVAALALVLALVLGATAVGLVGRARTGRVRLGSTPARAPDRDLAALAADHGALGRDATLVQFSTEFCTPCRATSRALGELASRRAGTAHVEIDLTERPDLARRLGILQTPTTFVLDGAGARRARIGGAPRIPELHALLDDLRGAARVGTS